MTKDNKYEVGEEECQNTVDYRCQKGAFKQRV